MFLLLTCLAMCNSLRTKNDINRPFPVNVM